MKKSPSQTSLRQKSKGVPRVATPKSTTPRSTTKATSKFSSLTSKISSLKPKSASPKTRNPVTKPVSKYRKTTPTSKLKTTVKTPSKNRSNSRLNDEIILGKTVTISTKDFVTSLLPLTYRTPFAKEERQNAWKSIAKSIEGYINLAELTKWLRCILEKDYGTDKGTTLWLQFKPIYILACMVTRGKDILKKENNDIVSKLYFKSSQTDSILKVEFRVLIARICYAATAFDAFNIIVTGSGIGSPEWTEVEQTSEMVTVEKLTINYEKIQHHGFVVSEKMKNTKDPNSTIEHLFQELDKNHDEHISFVELYHYFNKIEEQEGPNNKSQWSKLFGSISKSDDASTTSNISRMTSASSAIDNDTASSTSNNSRMSSSMMISTVNIPECPTCVVNSEQLEALESQLSEARGQLKSKNDEKRIKELDDELSALERNCADITIDSEAVALKVNFDSLHTKLKNSYTENHGENKLSGTSADNLLDILLTERDNLAIEKAHLTESVYETKGGVKGLEMTITVLEIEIERMNKNIITLAKKEEDALSKLELERKKASDEKNTLEDKLDAIQKASLCGTVKRDLEQDLEAAMRGLELEEDKKEKALKQLAEVTEECMNINDKFEALIIKESVIADQLEVVTAERDTLHLKFETSSATTIDFGEKKAIVKEKINELEPNLSANRDESSVSLEKINSKIEELQEKHEMEQKAAVDSIICLTTERDDALATITELTMKVGELRGKLDSVNETLSKSGVEGDLEDEVAVLRFKLTELLSDLDMVEEEKERLENQLLEETVRVEEISNLNSFLKSQVLELERMLAEEQESNSCNASAKTKRKNCSAEVNADPPPEMEESHGCNHKGIALNMELQDFSVSEKSIGSITIFLFILVSVLSAFCGYSLCARIKNNMSIEMHGLETVTSTISCNECTRKKDVMALNLLEKEKSFKNCLFQQDKLIMSYDKCATDLKVKWKKYAADNQCEYFGNQHVDKEVMEVKLHATQSSLKECHIELASCFSSRLSNTSFASESQTLLNDVSLISLKDKESSFQLIQKERADLISKLNKLSISLQQEYGYITNEMNARMAALQLESFSPL